MHFLPGYLRAGQAMVCMGQGTGEHGSEFVVVVTCVVWGGQAEEAILSF